MHVSSTTPSTVQYLTIKYRGTVPSTYFFNYIVSTMPSRKLLNPSPHAGIDLTPHTTTLPATTGRGRLIFSGYFCLLHHFCLCLLATSQFFLNWTSIFLRWEQPKLSPQTELFIPPHTTTLPTTTGSSEYKFVVSIHGLFAFFTNVW